MKESQILRRVIAVSGGLALMIGLIALAGWITGAGFFTSIFLRYIPMATSTAFLSIGFGLLFLSGSYSLQPGFTRSAILAAVGIFTLYALLKFIEYFVNADLAPDSIFFRATGNHGRFPYNRISPISGLLFFICGISTMIKMLGKERLFMLNLVCGTGLFVMFSGFTGLTGYLFNTPFFYGGDIIPLALPTTIVFFVLGCGLVALGGLQSFLISPFSGATASARVLRAIFPVIILAILADDLLEVALSKVSSVNHGIFMTGFILVFIPLTMWAVIKVSKVIFRRTEKVEAERKKMEAAIQESEKRYRLIFENQGEGIGLVDPDECFVFANPAAERIFGVPSGGLISRNLKDFLPPDQMIKVLAETKKRANCEKSSYEIDIISADNIVKNILVTATPQISSDGIFTGTFGIFRDITIRRQAQADLEEISATLKESNATKDKFFSIIAHDLKSPFNSILGLTNALITDYRFFNEKEIEHTLTTIKKASEGAFDLLENLLLWANSQTGRINYNPKEFNLDSAIYETIALVEVQAARKDIRIRYSGAENDVVTADIQMVQTILRNLMSNAIKFTPTGGEITVSAIKSDSCYEISVKDTGVGIAINDIPKLFKIESNHSTSGTSKEKGTGLGLILCKEFVEKHGGKIWVESEEGNLPAGKTGGSKFSFTLPY